MHSKHKGKSKKEILQPSDKKQQQAEPEIDNENVSNARHSRGRHSRYSAQAKVQSKTEVEDYQIRKALNTYVREELHRQGRKTYFQRVFVLARNVDWENPPENIRDSLRHTLDTRQLDYRQYFLKQIQMIFRNCDLKRCTNDQLTGFFVCMGTYSYLVIEGAEDMMSDFFDELTYLHDNLWTASKVFLVEDKIGDTYFNCFHTRTSPSININEKFPTSTATDTTLMSAQHFKIMEKVKTLAETFAKFLLKSEFPEHGTADKYTLPADPFNKLLPEIQRIDLVLSADKFYRNIKDFALTYRIMPSRADEDVLFWPIQQNYTPLAIFERSAFDVNLTFGDYGKEEKNNENENKTDKNDPEELAEEK